MKTPTSRPSFTLQSGLSLIELMIALTLSSLIMLGVMRMFVDSTRSSAADTALMQIQDSARIAMEIIKHDVRMAGFRGICVPPDAELTPGSLIDFNSESISGTEGGGTQSDTLAVLRAEEVMRATSPMDTTLTTVEIKNFDNSGNIELDRAICYSNTDVLLASDCRSLAVFQPQQSDDQYACDDSPEVHNLITPKGKTGNLSLDEYIIPPNCSGDSPENCPLLYSLGSTAGMVYKVYETERLGSDAQPIRALFRGPGPEKHPADTELVEGIENLQVLYGIKDGDDIYYDEGCSIDEFTGQNCTPGLKTHVKISLVVASSNNIAATAAPKTLPILNLDTDDQQLITTDRRLRRVFTTTIQMRNQG